MAPVNAERLERERQHALEILKQDESNWGWNTAAGQIRRARRAGYLAGGSGVRPDVKVLEVGCGTGTFTGALAEVFPRLVAIDIAQPMIDVARGKFPSVDFRVMDAHALQFHDDTFDLVVGCSTLHHLDWVVALREILRVLEAGGEIRFSEPNLANPQIFVQKSWPWLKRRMGDSPDEYAFTRRRILRDLSRSGFVECSAEPYEFLHPGIPERAIATVLRLERVLERTPLREIAGSLRIAARKPAVPQPRQPRS